MRFTFCFKNPEFSYESMKKEVEDEIQEATNFLEEYADRISERKKQECIKRIRELTSLLDRLAEEKKEAELIEERNRIAYEAMDKQKKEHLDALVVKLMWREAELKKPHGAHELELLGRREENKRLMAECLTPIYEFITEEQIEFLSALPDDLDHYERWDIHDYLLNFIGNGSTWDGVKRKISELLEVRHAVQNDVAVENKFIEEGHYIRPNAYKVY